jgi:hypothetical protein
VPVGSGFWRRRLDVEFLADEDGRELFRYAETAKGFPEGVRE